MEKQKKKTESITSIQMKAFLDRKTKKKTNSNEWKKNVRDFVTWGSDD